MYKFLFLIFCILGIQACTNKKDEVSKEVSTVESGKSIGDVVRFTIATEDGNIIGWRVRPGRNPDLFKRSPFKNGDVILGVNGVAVDSVENAKKAAIAFTHYSGKVLFDVKRKKDYITYAVDFRKLLDMPEIREAKIFESSIFRNFI